MRVTRFARLAVLILPLSAACNEDNEFGLGIRGQDQFSATLSGTDVRPAPVVTTATATASFTLRDPEIGQGNPTLVYAVTSTSLISARVVDIHAGGSAVTNGPILATLFTNPTDTAITAALIVSGALSTNAVLAKGSPAHVQVKVPGSEPILLQGRVIRTRRIASALLMIATGGMGVRLENPPAGWRVSLSLPDES